jgi:hypothetical protein
MDFFTADAGQRRRAALDEFGRDIGYYVPPELRNLLGFAAEMTPTATLERAGQASQRMLDADRTAMERVGDFGTMLSETAGVAAPIMVANRAAMPIADAVQEGLLGFSVGAQDVGRAVVDRLNQPGPVPTMYSNPLFGPTGTPQTRGLLNELDFADAYSLQSATPFQRLGSAQFAAPRQDASRAKDLALYTPYSTIRQSGIAPSDWEVSGMALPGSGAVGRTPEDFEGGLLFGYPADSTPIDEVITSLNNIPLPRGVLQQGGHRFPDQGLGFASDERVLAPRVNTWNQIYESGRTPYVSPMTMGTAGGDFALHPALTMVQAIRGNVDNIDPNFVPKLPAALAETFPGLTDPRLTSWVQSLTGTQRSAFMKALDTGPAMAAGVPSAAAVRWATTDAPLQGADLLSSGFRVFQPEYGRMSPSDVGGHYTYGATIGREGDSMTLGGPRPWSLMFPDVAYGKITDSANLAERRGRRMPGSNELPDARAMPKDLRAFQMNPNLSQEMDAEWVDANSMYDEMMSRFGPEMANQYALEAMFARAARAGR